MGDGRAPQRPLGDTNDERAPQHLPPPLLAVSGVACQSGRPTLH